MPDSKQLRILLVEDDKSVAMAVKKLLENQGYQCDLAKNPLEGILDIGRAQYDLAILDYHFEVFTGKDVEEYAKARKVPTMFYTASAGRLDVKSPVISKTKGPRELLQAVDEILGEQAPGRETTKGDVDDV
jgi:CheY-like chemotaxis protein